MLQPVGLAVYGEYVYWVDSKTMNVERVTKSGKRRSLIQTKVDKLTDIIAVNRTKKAGRYE